MLSQNEKRRVFLALGATDLRKAIDGLSLLVCEELSGELLSGDLFVFRNRKGHMVKILYWDRNGFALWMKRLEKQRFKWPETEGEISEIGIKELLTSPHNVNSIVSDLKPPA